jgi:UDP-hydrolysing UDP-N-acetyl-D-glucosamine 2-epimerase
VPLPEDELGALVGMPLDGPTLVATFHPATLDFGNPGERVDELLAAVDESGLSAVFTSPSADPGGEIVRRRIEEHAGTGTRIRYVANLGSRAYFSLLRTAVAMVGNSSSGIIEAPSFELPVVNVGIRQHGRTRAANVIDVGDDRNAILAGIRRAVSPPFRRSLAGLRNPYGDGHAAERIVEHLATVDLGPQLLVKRFVDRDE